MLVSASLPTPAFTDKGLGSLTNIPRGIYIRDLSRGNPTRPDHGIPARYSDSSHSDLDGSAQTGFSSI